MTVQGCKIVSYRDTLGEIHSSGNEMKIPVRVNNQKAKRRLVKELCEAKRENLGKLSKKLKRKITANSKEKLDNLKACHLTKRMSTNQRQKWRPEIGKVQVSEQLNREVRESMVCSPKSKATGKDALL